MDRWEMSRADTINFIRSLLFANKGMYALPDFLNDFEEGAGYGLPSFGYNTPLEFLASLEHTVEVISCEKMTYLQLIVNGRPGGFKPTPSATYVKKGHNPFAPSSPTSSAQTLSFKHYTPKRKFCKKKCTAAMSKEGMEGTEEMAAMERTEEMQAMGEGTSQNDDPDHLHHHHHHHAGMEEKEGEDSGEQSENQDSDDDTFCPGCVAKWNDFSHGTAIDKSVETVIIDESDVPLLNLREHVKISGYIEVTVPEVRNPHKFVIHFRKYAYELAKMMGMLLIFYSMYGENYVIKNFKFGKDQLCAVLYKTNEKCKEWYRARMINFGVLSSTVYLLDYGITTEVCNFNIRFLHRYFGYLPEQAVNGHLANIKPYRGKYWTEDSCKRFYKHVYEEDLVAQVVTMDTKKQWLSVVLLYPEGEGFRINDNLVRGKFPVADCDFYEDEPFSQVFYDSINPKGFIQAKDVGKVRKSRSGFFDRGGGEIYKRLKQMIGIEFDDNDYDEDEDKLSGAEMGLYDIEVTSAEPF